MIVKYIDNDGGNEIISGERGNVSELLAILKSDGQINIRWPHEDSFWHGKFSEAILDVEIDKDGNSKEELLIYFDLIGSK